MTTTVDRPHRLFARFYYGLMAAVFAWLGSSCLFQNGSRGFGLFLWIIAVMLGFAIWRRWVGILLIVPTVILLLLGLVMAAYIGAWNGLLMIATPLVVVIITAFFDGVLPALRR